MSSHPNLVITSIHNQRIVAARKLQSRKHRQRQGRFLAEGFDVLQIALDTGAKPIEVFHCDVQSDEPATRKLLDRFRDAHADIVAASPQVMQTLSAAAGNVYADRRRVSTNGISQSIVATFALFETSVHAINFASNELVLVLDQTQTPGNLGMLMRVADAVGAAAIFLIPPCVDAFHPKTVRGSHGALFTVPLVQTADVPKLFAWLREREFRGIGADPHRGQTWNQNIWEGRVALILGHDVRGLSDEVRAQVDVWTQLPMTGKVESLNVAVAGGVLIYEWFRVNRLCVG